ncbi:MAG: bacterioferritin [Zetaproteobacteria bacterium]|nr:bacterioferritin [Pseudobdellovibrionaceae bacterium]|tara:strand:+ start:1210 stop:1674 length:465 start_codon:yes stop_codon:yes gene_type:complete
MQGHADVIKGLNEVLTKQLTAINQYFLHARMLKNWGYNQIAEKVWKESIHQMKEAQKVSDRILFLDGLPNFQKLFKLEIGEHTHESLQNDRKYCEGACDNLRRVTQVCLDSKDHVSRELVEDLLVKEEEYLDWIETQLSTIDEIGLQKYLAEKI